jgi:hypothetical protein
MIESLTASMNKRFNKTTTSMNEMFHKSQASTDTTLERVQCGIAAMADQVQALETQLPIAQLTQMWWLTQILQQLTHMLTMIHSIKIQGLTMMSTPIFMILLHTHVGPSNRQGTRGNPNHHNQHYVHNEDPFAKVKFSIPPFNG